MDCRLHAGNRRRVEWIIGSIVAHHLGCDGIPGGFKVANITLNCGKPGR